MAPERCLVTGATGFLGGALARRLLDHGHRVRLLLRGRSDSHDRAGANDPAFDDADSVIGDLRDPGSLTGIATDIDVVYHLAGMTHTNRAGLYHEVNVAGTENLLRECRRAAVRRFVYFGSRADDPGAGAYSRSKHDAAVLVRRSGVPFTTLRIAEVYGGTGEGGLAMIPRLVESYPVVPIIGGASFQLCPVHVDDVVSAAVDAATTGATLNRAYVIAGPECHSLEAIIKLAMRHRGVSKQTVRVPVSLIEAAARLDAWVPGKEPFLVRDQIARLASPKESDISAARADFGFEPRPFADNLHELF